MYIGLVGGKMSDFETHPVLTAKEIKFSRALARAISENQDFSQLSDEAKEAFNQLCAVYQEQMSLES